jgi:diketogulonate reductase-like aldo/keto reductase
MYDSEESLGAALDGRRPGRILATKIWAPSVEDGRRQYADQLRFFGRVELQQVHNLLSWQEHLPWLQEERAAGRIDRLGVTHSSPGSFLELERAPHRPLRRGPDPAEPARARGRGTDPAARGRARARRRRHAPLGGSEGVRLRREPSAGELEPLRAYGVETWAQALLKWALSDRRVDLVIPATSRPERAAENACANEPPWLPDELRELVRRLARA